ncbi:MAG: GOLPH3/VPS74 family protein [Longimicrobiales bacterium]
MAGEPTLYLHEELLLLALNDETGTLAFGSMFSYAVGGAILAELMLRDRIAIEQVRKSKLVNIARTSGVGDPLLDECLEQIRTAKKRKSVLGWVGKFAGKSLRDRIADRLCLRGVLRKEDRRVLFVFSRRAYPTVNPEPERELVARMRQAIFQDGVVDSRTAIAVSLASNADLLRPIFGKKELKPKKKKIEELTRSTEVSRATKEAIEAARAAVMAASSIVAIAFLVGCEPPADRAESAPPPPAPAAFDWDMRVGVANLLQDTTCMEIATASLAEGTTVLLVSPSEPQRTATAKVAARVDACPGDPVNVASSYYRLVSSDSLNVTRVYIALLQPGGNPRLAGDTLFLDVDADGHEERFRECTSMEGLHLTIWTGAPLTGQRRWHTYYYLGYDLQPTCTEAET